MQALRFDHFEATLLSFFFGFYVTEPTIVDVFWKKKGSYVNTT